MLKPEVFIFEIGGELRSRLRPKILSAIFESLAEMPPRRHTSDGTPLLTVSDAKDRLTEKLPVYRELVGAALPTEWRITCGDAVEMGKLLHEWLEKSVVFFRREGAQILRDALGKKTGSELYQYVWQALFRRKLVPLAKSSGMLIDDSGLRESDMLIECMKLWTRKLCEDIEGRRPDEFSPSAYFLDVESDMEGTIRLEDGRKFRLRGRPDAISFDQTTGELGLWEYKFGRQGQYEIQVAQGLLYIDLLEAAKGTQCNKALLAVFRPTEDTSIPDEICRKIGARTASPPFPDRVEHAFEGYIGNAAAVRQIKIDLTLACRENPPRMDQNIMFCGPAGLGKTELARRVASCLGTPLVDVNATGIKSLEHLVSMIDSTLESNRCSAVQVVDLSGKPLLKYPPLVLFIDEAHELRKKADQFLNVFEPRDRKCNTSGAVCDFQAATILLATTEKGKLPKPFLDRFHIINLCGYSVDEVAQMVAHTFQRNQRQVPVSVCEALAQVGRLVPRTALELTKDFLKKNQFDPEVYPLTPDGLEQMRAEFWKSDEQGLTSSDLQYLRCVSDSPKGLPTLIGLLPYGKEEIETVVEPYLLQIEAIRRTQRGREITEIGRRIVARESVQ